MSAVQVKVATEQEIASMIEACSRRCTAIGSRDSAIIATMWSSGAWRDEMVRLRVDDVDLEGRSMLIRSPYGPVRPVPLDQRAVHYLARWLEWRDVWAKVWPVDGGDALWVGRNGALTRDAMRQAIERRSREAGVNVTPYSIPLGFVAHSRARGISENSLALAVGWRFNLRNVSITEDEMLAEYHNRMG